jgi:hypothetical protein
MKLFDIFGWHGKCYWQGKDEIFATARRLLHRARHWHKGFSGTL